MKALQAELLTPLQVRPGAGAPQPWCAASALVLLGERLYSVADDELGLAAFELAAPARPGRCWPLVAAPPLPEQAAPRKARKPDLEALCSLPAAAAWPHGALLALGSGSTPQRCSWALQPLDAAGLPAGTARPFDASALYAALRPAHPLLNIEGACVAGERFWLAQRGQPGGQPNRLLGWPLAALLDWLAGRSAPSLPMQALDCPLGALDGVPLGLTDLCALADGRLLFSAAAEDSDNPVADGTVSGSVLGCLDPAGGLQLLGRLPGTLKVEGLVARPAGAGLDAWLVTDADQRGVAAQLLHLRLPI
ncbi:DUF6929 family protein [Inhella proteolytica]|uniref:Uncharacterized protein n=1 Tax=Inhella proteolytica TaxID=2795029 RepID=A0A931J1Z1_9BURK|nr:hypothetical protein [Inhella proteolytica]MBH9576851.1 hypothetical protein [Inhella proteolytica]